MKSCDYDPTSLRMAGLCVARLWWSGRQLLGPACRLKGPTSATLSFWIKLSDLGYTVVTMADLGHHIDASSCHNQGADCQLRYDLPGVARAWLGARLGSAGPSQAWDLLACFSSSKLRHRPTSPHSTGPRSEGGRGRLNPTPLCIC